MTASSATAERNRNGATAVADETRNRLGRVLKTPVRRVRAGVEKVGDELRDKSEHVHDAAQEKIRKSPMKATGTVAVAGLALGALAGWALHRRLG